MSTPLVTSQSRVYEPLKFFVQHKWGNCALAYLSKPQLSVEMDYAAEDMVLTLAKRILSNRVQERPVEVSISDTLVATIRVPNSWWDHLKNDLFPRWLIRVFPVVWATMTKEFPVTLEKSVVLQEHYYCCPHHDVPWDAPTRLHFRFLDEDHWTTHS